MALFEHVLRSLPEVGPVGEPAGELADWEVEELRAGGFDLSPVRPDEPDPRAHTVARYAALLSQSLTLAQAAERLGVDPSRLRQRLAAGTLYGIKLGEGWRLPLFQFDGDRLLPNLGRVVSRIPRDAHPLGIANWFERADPDLELNGEPVSPREWLRSGGDPDAITPPDLQV